jgi:predicted negative regulator of RcsB-dependent stress response
MDSEHRHELKQNDLQEFLTHFKDFWAKWGNTITVVVLVVVIAVTGYRFIKDRHMSARERALSELATLTTPTALMDLARSTDDEVVRARAYLKGGDLILHRLAMPVSERAGADGPAAKPMDAAERDRHLAEAASMYGQVAAKPPHQIYGIAARLGLGAVAESQGKWDDAAAAYEQVASDAAANFPALAGQARMRLAMLERLRVPVVFAPEPATPEPGAAVDLDALPMLDADAPGTDADAEVEAAAPVDAEGDVEADASPAQDPAP